MSIRKLKRKAMRNLGYVVAARSRFLQLLKREIELEDMAMEAINKVFPDFAPVFQTMPRLPMGWSLL